MKTTNFLFKVENNKGKCETKIYSIEKNVPSFVGITKYRTGSFRGHDHEVFAYLVENGFVTVKDRKTIKDNVGTIYYQNVWKNDKMILDVRSKYKLFEI